MRKVLIGTAIAVIGALASANVASAAPGSYISFGGRAFGTVVSLPATSGITSVESPDKILAGDASGFQITSFGHDIDPTATVNQIVTTATK
ncbi:MAG: hypothetical protein LBR33_06755 [Propionibacteriaceae bacterium]|jgi:hypothetical protein|nr:hypothetical protein [Propionibacteriaceae bacterium]